MNGCVHLIARFILYLKVDEVFDDDGGSHIPASKTLEVRRVIIYEWLCTPYCTFNFIFEGQRGVSRRRGEPQTWFGDP